LAFEDIFSLLKIVARWSFRPSLNFIEPRSEVCRRLSLGADRVEVGSGCVLALGERYKLMAGAFDDGKGNDVARHFPWFQYQSESLGQDFIRSNSLLLCFIDMNRTGTYSGMSYSLTYIYSHFTKFQLGSIPEI
jgi:hypothetical protein